MKIINSFTNVFRLKKENRKLYEIIRFQRERIKNLCKTIVEYDKLAKEDDLAIEILNPIADTKRKDIMKNLLNRKYGNIIKI